MMRSTLKNIDYFENLINQKQSLIKKINNLSENDTLGVEKVNIANNLITSKYISLIHLQYSAGYPIKELGEIYKIITNRIYKYYEPGKMILRHREKIYDIYYLSSFDSILWLLSIGFLIRAKEEFQRLVEVVDKDEIKDLLYETIIKEMQDDREKKEEDINRDDFGISENVFGTIRAAIEAKTKEESEKLIKRYLEKDWYPNHKDASWYGTHEKNTYTGYWCYEAAAITKVLKLDDSSYRDHKYYPKDLADYYDQNTES